VLKCVDGEQQQQQQQQQQRENLMKWQSRSLMLNNQSVLW